MRFALVAMIFALLLSACLGGVHDRRPAPTHPAATEQHPAPVAAAPTVDAVAGPTGQHDTAGMPMMMHGGGGWHWWMGGMMVAMMIAVLL